MLTKTTTITADVALLAADLDNLSLTADAESAAWKISLAALTVHEYAQTMPDALEILEELAVTRATTAALYRETVLLNTVTATATAYAEAAETLIKRSRARRRRALPMRATIGEVRS